VEEMTVSQHVGQAGWFLGFLKFCISSDVATAGPAHRLNHRALDISSTQLAKVARGKTSPSIAISSTFQRGDLTVDRFQKKSILTCSCQYCRELDIVRADL